MNTNKRKLRVFLSYASQDRPVVRELYERLKDEGWIDPWLDAENLTLGQHWTTVIEDALDEADAVIVFLSGNSVQKEGFIQRELNHAWELSLEKPRNVIFLIPLRLDECQVPRYLRSRQWGDYFGKQKEIAYSTLLHSLQERNQQVLRLEKGEKAEREAAKKAVMEKAEREAPKKAAKEKAESETTEKTTKDKAERKAKEKIQTLTSAGKEIPDELKRERNADEKSGETKQSRLRGLLRNRSSISWARGAIGILVVLSLSYSMVY